MARSISGNSYITDEQRWQAVANRDRRAEGVFVYSVKTTGVYCKPACASRLANRANVQFHDSCEAAEASGFRPCKRCRPSAGELTQPNAARIERACRLIESSPKSPSLAELATAADLSTSHFQRMFKSQLGITPREYAMVQRRLRVQHELAERKPVTQAIYKAGYGSSSQFYGESAQSLGMSPRQFRDAGAGLIIRFAIGRCWLGAILVAATDTGICAILLGDDSEKLLQDLVSRFSKADLVRGNKQFGRTVNQVIGFLDQPARGLDLPLDIQGTVFQQRVWAALRQISPGRTVTYAEIARQLGMPRAVRAVAGACAANSIAVAIPCHRVIRSDGDLAGYRWGVERKKTLLERESQAVAARRSI